MYTQCGNCNGWLRLDMPHIVAEVDGKTIHLHDEACLRLLQHKVVVTEVKKVPAVIYQD
jgi:Fe-S oxidoreductase